MKVVFVADAYITTRMMSQAAEKCLTESDSYSLHFFGEEKRDDMRSIVKEIESGRRKFLKVPMDLYADIEDADVLVVHLCPVNKDLLLKAKKLKAVLSCRGGKENIDVEYALSKGIVITTNPAHNANAVAEFTIGLMICETRNIARSNIAIKNGIWREKYPNTESTIREMCDLTVGVIGYGAVGKLVVKKLSSFGCRILINDPYIDENAYDLINNEFVELDALLEKSDIITLHARSNTPIISDRELNMCKKNAYLINTARSKLIDSEALKNALKNGKLLGAAIDVFESEPDIPEFYTKYDNITLTNHRGGDTINSYKDSPVFALENYFGYLRGKKLLFQVK